MDPFRNLHGEIENGSSFNSVLQYLTSMWNNMVTPCVKSRPTFINQKQLPAIQQSKISSKKILPECLKTQIKPIPQIPALYKNLRREDYAHPS